MSTLLPNTPAPVRFVQIDVETLRYLVSTTCSSGNTVTRAVAMSDLRADIAQDRLASHRHYARRWNWSPSAVWRLFVEYGLAKHQRTDDEAATGASEPPSCRSLRDLPGRCR